MYGQIRIPLTGEGDRPGPVTGRYR